MESVYFKPLQMQPLKIQCSVSLKNGHLQHTPPIIPTSLGRPYFTETVIYREQHFICLWKPKFFLTPLFVQKQSDWITEGHQVRPNTALSKEELILITYFGQEDSTF